MHISISAEPIFHIGNMPVTNTMITGWIAILVLVVISFIVSKSIKQVPGRLQALSEIIIEGLFNFLSTFAGSKEKTKTFFPFVATIFFLVLTSNWIGTLPGVESIGFHEIHDGYEIFVPLFRTANSDINMTLAIALIVIIGSHIVGLYTIRHHHLSKFFVNPFKSPIKSFIGILELIGEVSKTLSLTFRLFGNIFAGSVLMLIISFLAPFVLPIPFLGLELFVGFIQALVFAVLAMMFMAGATEAHHAEH